MKKLLFLCAPILMLVSCNDSEPKDEWNPQAYITIQGKENPNHLKKQSFGLTPLEVVQRANNLVFRTQYADSHLQDYEYESSRGINEDQKDYGLPAIRMYGSDIIAQAGYFVLDFICARDVYITQSGDTVGFIPDSVLINAFPLLEKAYEAEDYNEVYRLFNEAFVFYPL